MYWKASFVLVLVGTLLMACGASTPVSIPATTTPQPSLTPLPPTETPMPTTTETPAPTEKAFLPGWKLFKGENFDLWLPDTYQGGASAEDLDAAAQRHRDAGQDELAQFVERNKSLLLFYGLDTLVNNPDGFFPSLMIFAELPTHRPNSSAEYFAYMFDKLYGDPECEVFWTFKSEAVSIPGFDAYRQVVEHDCKQNISVEYLLKDGKDIWFLIYTVATSEFEVRLPVFELSASTFTLK